MSDNTIAASNTCSLCNGEAFRIAPPEEEGGSPFLLCEGHYNEYAKRKANEAAGVTERKNTYNGWTNRATWLVNLHFGTSGEMFAAMVHDADGLISSVADAYEEYIREYIEEFVTDAFISDLIDLSAINWHELAGHLIDEHYTEEEEEDEDSTEEDSDDLSQEAAAADPLLVRQWIESNVAALTILFYARDHNLSVLEDWDAAQLNGLLGQLGHTWESITGIPYTA